MTKRTNRYQRATSTRQPDLFEEQAFEAYMRGIEAGWSEGYTSGHVAGWCDGFDEGRRRSEEERNPPWADKPVGSS